MRDILDEVKDDLAHEKSLNLFKKYTPYIILFMIAFIVGTGVKLWWVEHKSNKAYEAGAEYTQAIQQMRMYNHEEGAKIFENLSHNSSAYGAVSALNLASYWEIRKEFAKAVAAYDTVVERSGIDRAIINYARVLQVRAALEGKLVSVEDAIKSLLPLVKSDEVFSLQAKELLANLYIENSEGEKANEQIMSILGSSEASDVMKERVKHLQQLVSN